MGNYKTNIIFNKIVVICFKQRYYHKITKYIPYKINNNKYVANMFG